MNLLKKIGLLFATSLLSVCAFGTTRYVTTTGSDSNPCTLASPCATPTHADAIATAGDTVNVAAGVYSYGSSAATFSTGGTSGNPITITCATRGACRITNTITGNATVVYLHAANLVFDGFEVTNTGAGNNLGVYVDTSNVSITRNIIHDIQTDCGSNGGGGIQIAVLNLNNIVIDSNQVYNISWVSGAPKCDNTVVQTDGILTEQTGFSTTTAVTNNLVYNVSGGWCILSSTNAAITSNTVFNCVNGGIGLNNAPAGALVENNIIAYTGLLASNSLRYGGACPVQNGTASSTTYGHNDLAGNRDGGGGSGFTYGTGFGCNPAKPLNTGDITADPAGGTIFLNWQQDGSGDYHEKTGSPTIGAGTTVSLNHDYDGHLRPSGTGFDMGAYQFNQTWYVRSDGGTRYDSVAQPTGQCDGVHDAAYSGTGVNQPCAYNDYRWLFDNQAFGGLHWVISGGDTVIIKSCKTGPNNTAPSCREGSDTQTGSGSGWCPGLGNAGCWNPPIPAGTSTQHTRILGGNYGACSVGNEPDKSQMQELFGGFGLGVVLNLGSTSFVDVQCLNVTRHSQCTFFGSPANPPGCNRSFPAEDDYADNGATTNNTSHDIFMQDLWIHGFLSRGVIGPIGGLVQCTRCDIDTNGGAGWDFDDGSGTPMGAGANWVFNDSTIEWSGCNQQYPFTTAIPVASCFSQSSGGYGDAVGTPVGTGLSVSWNRSYSIYNTQDANDLGHVDTGGPYHLSLTNSFAAHNGGSNGWKWDDKFGSPTDPVIVTGNLILGDCSRMSAPITGVSTNYNLSLSDFCRAGDNWPFNFNLNTNAIVENNTAIGYPSTFFDWSCNAAGGVPCPSATLHLKNNIILGYANLGAPCGGSNPPCAPGFANNPGSNYGGTNAGPGLINLQNGGPGVMDFVNNLCFQIRSSCPSTGFTLASPVLAGQPTGNGVTLTESEFDVFGTRRPIQSAWKLGSGSPAIGAGVANPNFTTDIFGNAPTSPLPIGAVNPTGAPTLTSIAVTPNPGSVNVSSTLAMTCTATFSDSSTSPCSSPVWTDTNTHSSINSSTGVVTGISGGSDTVTATIGSVSGNATVNVVALIPGPVTSLGTTQSFGPTSPI